MDPVCRNKHLMCSSGSHNVMFEFEDDASKNNDRLLVKCTYSFRKTFFCSKWCVYFFVYSSHLSHFAIIQFSYQISVSTWSVKIWYSHTRVKTACIIPVHDAKWLKGSDAARVHEINKSLGCAHVSLTTHVWSGCVTLWFSSTDGKKWTN